MKRCRNGMRGWLSLRAAPVVAALAAIATVGLAFSLSGCESNLTDNPASVGLVNQYFGTAGQAAQVGSIGATWSTTLDPTTSYFSYTDLTDQGSTAGATPLNGSFTTSTSGLLDLKLPSGTRTPFGLAGVGGYAVSLPGEGLLVRTGSSSADVFGHSPSALIAATKSAACPAFTSAETFNFIAQGTTNEGDTVVHVAYGSVEITPVTSGSADSWSFSNFTMYDLSGNSLSPSAIPDATCPATQEGFVLVSPLSSQAYYPQRITTGVSPSGLLVIDQGQNFHVVGSSTFSNFDTTPTGPTGLMGVLKPTTALNVSDMVGKKYVGFESDPLSNLGTIAVVFGNTSGSGTAITGGGFPKDDVTQTPRTDTTLNLGAQSTQTPGLFISVTLTQPDTFAVCAGTPSGGTDANGNPTCIFHGVAVAGQVNGKYVIYTNINDPTARINGQATPLAAINLALYQQ